MAENFEKDSSILRKFMLIFFKHFQYMVKNLRAELPYMRSDQRGESEVSSTEIKLGSGNKWIEVQVSDALFMKW